MSVTTFPSLAPPYALVEELRQFLDIPPGQEANDVDLQRALDAGQRWIDWFTGRTFALTAATEARVWTATTLDLVPLVDLQSTSPTVAVDTNGDRTFSTTLVAAQYLLEPAAPAGPPFDALRAWPTPDTTGTIDPIVFEPGQLVRVTGIYGYADPGGGLPANVNQANLLLGARWFARREAPFSVLQSAQLDVFQRVPPIDADVHSLLFSLCLPGSPGAALLAQQVPGAIPGGGASWVMV